MSALGLASLSDWMIDTFVYTALLIGLVLLVRRPVARHFGPQIAYALWALPLLRFVMPPIVLPAWMAPADPVAQAAAPASAEPLMVIISETSANAADMAGPAAVPTVGIAVLDLLLPLWLGGAAIFLFWRTRDYVRMRRDLLADARPMGDAGKVRLVETPAVTAPVAFGIFDKVVALPEGFMALIDVKARDMAIAHELEHHRGHDLLANIAAQPVLALHWFNPLAWWGWREMRRDQEAACDARVVCGRARSERAAYAEVIAGFAAGEHLALAAPMASGMACPVLGEKSIIHRLRSLTLTDISTRRRRIGIAALTTTALALPLTASISYAAPEQSQDADAPVIETIDPDDGQRVVRIERHVERDADGQVVADADGEHHVEVHIIRDGAEGDDGERRVIRRIVRNGEDVEMSEAELEQMFAEIEREMEGVQADVQRHVEIALTHAARAQEIGNNVVVIEQGEEGSHNIDVRCDGASPVVQQNLSDGRRAMVICHTNIQAQAAEGLRAALVAIANNDRIDAETRTEVRRELERAISEMESARAEMGQISYRIAPPPPPAPPKPARAAAAPRASVAYGWAVRPAPEARQLPMVSPITGVAMDSAAQEDCEEAEARARARLIARVSA